MKLPGRLTDPILPFAVFGSAHTPVEMVRVWVSVWERNRIIYLGKGQGETYLLLTPGQARSK